MRNSQFVLISLFLSFLFVSNVHSGWQDGILKQAGDILGGTDSASIGKAAGSLSNGDISAGLKQALDIGVKKAVDILGKKDGFLKDEAVKILMPEKLRKVEEFLRSVGQDKIADDFILSMNNAAEKAVPQVTNIFADSIKKMSIQDAKQILTGPDNAATQYFKKNTSEQLQQLISPQVKNSMASADVTKYYNSMLNMVKEYDKFGLMKRYLGVDEGNLESYVTDKTMDGLFSKIAIQEKAIRDNPAMRSTDLLKRVFGSI